MRLFNSSLNCELTPDREAKEILINILDGRYINFPENIALCINAVTHSAKTPERRSRGLFFKVGAYWCRRGLLC